MKHVFYFLICAFLFVGCSNQTKPMESSEEVVVNSELDLEKFLLNKTFKTNMKFCNWKIGQFYIKYKFSNNSVVVNLKDRRTDEEFNISSDYKVKSSKFVDNGVKYYYVAVHVVGTGGMDNTEYWIFRNGTLIAPSGNHYSDEHGLVLNEYQINMSTGILTPGI